jgi:hypothetical protein
MTITSGLAHPRRRSTAVTTTPIEAPEPIIERIGVDDPKTAHGGRPRRMPAPLVPGGLVIRVRPPALLATRVRRVRADASSMVDAA